MIKRIFFDFGGCLDAPGIHTRTLFWDAFMAEKLVDEQGRTEFQEAYTQADRRMMATGEAKTMGLAPFNRHQALLIAGAAGLSESGAKRAGDRVTRLMQGYLEASRASLPLFKGYRLSIISNFTGNLELILEESGLRASFDSITESFYAGASKPDLRIFQAALAKHPEPAAQCLYVGDNPVNDIAPAGQLGMKTALIYPAGKRRECGAHYYVEDLRALFSAIQSK